jgi:ATP/maltotriose-dependent transcriptional regulator MalT
MSLFRKSGHILLYSAVLAVLAFALKWLEWRFLIALLFTGLGVWMATQLTRTRVKTVVVEREVVLPRPPEGTVDEAELEKLGLSDREYEVLKLMVQGRSNAEIAESLFLSVSTIKTHASNLFDKMDVKNRAQAMEKARRLRLTP